MSLRLNHSFLYRCFLLCWIWASLTSKKKSCKSSARIGLHHFCQGVVQSLRNVTIKPGSIRNERLILEFEQLRSEGCDRFYRLSPQLSKSQQLSSISQVFLMNSRIPKRRSGSRAPPLARLIIRRYRGDMVQFNGVVINRPLWRLATKTTEMAAKVCATFTTTAVSGLSAKRVI